MKRNKLNLGSFLLIFLMAFYSAYAGDKSKVGTVSGTQVLVPVGARSIAMGQAIIADVGGSEALYWNPAGLVRVKNSEVEFSNNSYIADINVNYFAAAINAGNMGTVGLFLKAFDFGDIMETTEDYPDGTGKTFSPTYVTAGVAYARKITDLINAGFSMKYIYEGIMSTSASTFAFDLGVQYKLNDNISLGVVMSNVGGKLRYSGENLQYVNKMPNRDLLAENGYFEAMPLKSNIPSQFTFGASYKREIAEGQMIRLNGSFTSVNEYSDQMGVGIEYGYNNLVFLRAGYTSDYQAKEQIFGPRVGGGLNWKVGNFTVKADYTFLSVSKYFDNMNIFSLKIEM